MAKHSNKQKASLPKTKLYFHVTTENEWPKARQQEKPTDQSLWETPVMTMGKTNYDYERVNNDDAI